jgi:hypothetical protein
VIVIAIFVDPARVVKERKQCDDLNIGSGCLSHSHSIFQNTGPVGDAMIAVHWQSVSFEDRF